MPRPSIETRIPWPRERRWRPGEPMTLDLDGRIVTCLLRGVMRDTDPGSHYATVTLEPIRATAAIGADEDAFSAAS